MVRQARGGGTAPTPSVVSEAKEFSPPGSEKKSHAPVRRLDPREQLAEDRARMKHRLPDDIAGVSIYVEDPEIRDDPKQAWLYFRERCRIAHVLEDNKRVLKEKYTEAKACGEKVNATRKAIAYLKQSIEAIRRERAIEGVVNEDDLQKADPEEQRKIDAIAQEKEVYKQNFESLRRLKTEIEHVQRMLESGRKSPGVRRVVCACLEAGHNKPQAQAWATPPASPAQSSQPKEEDLCGNQPGCQFLKSVSMRPKPNRVRALRAKLYALRADSCLIKGLRPVPTTSRMRRARNKSADAAGARSDERQEKRQRREAHDDQNDELDDVLSATARPSAAWRSRRARAVVFSGQTCRSNGYHQLPSG